LIHQVVGSWQFFALSIRGEKVVELSKAPNPGFPQMDGRMIEFGEGPGQMQVFDILYILRITGAGKGPQLAQAYLKGLDGAV
jgi:hypothetical protein